MASVATISMSLELRGELVDGQALAVLAVVVDDGDRLGLELRRDVLGHAGGLGGVVGEDPVEHLAVGHDVGQLGVGGRRAHHHEAVLLERGQHGPGLAREGGADEAEDLLVVDVLVEHGRRLGGIALGVELLERDLVVGVGLVELLDRHLGAVADVDAQVGGVTGERADEGDRELLAS